MKILLTCPPMIGLVEMFADTFSKHGIEIVIPDFQQVMTEEALIDILPTVDGWIIGDDPATKKVFAAGKAGRLRAAVKWGVGTDNVDLEACRELEIPISNTPGMFGNEVADLAIHYLIGLARETFYIHKSVKNGDWVKPPGISLQNKNVGVIGYGDIGRHCVKRLLAFDINITIYDPFIAKTEIVDSDIKIEKWPSGLDQLDFFIATCALTQSSKYMINERTISAMKSGVRIVNVSRGGIIDENALINGLKNGKVHSVALDVFEVEPLPQDSELRTFESCIFGTHNGSNTIDAVLRASEKAIDLIFGFLSIKKS